jgi:hypothetical protein
MARRKKNVSVANTKGLSYAEISKIMTDSGDKMNHNNVRAIMIKSFAKIADHIGKFYDIHHDKNKLEKIVINASFQNNVIEILKEEIFYKIMENEKGKKLNDSEKNIGLSK